VSVDEAGAGSHAFGDARISTMVALPVLGCSSIGLIIVRRSEVERDDVRA